MGGCGQLLFKILTRACVFPDPNVFVFCFLFQVHVQFFGPAKCHCSSGFIQHRMFPGHGNVF